MKKMIFGAQGPQKYIFGARGIPGGSRPLGRLALGHGPIGPGPWADGPFGPIGPLDLGPWARAQGPGTRNEYNVNGRADRGLPLEGALCYRMFPKVRPQIQYKPWCFI